MKINKKLLLLSVSIFSLPSYSQTIIETTDTFTIYDLMGTPTHNSSRNIENKIGTRYLQHKSAENGTWEQDYKNFKDWLKNETGISYSLDLSLTVQRATSTDSGTSNQFLGIPSLSWELFDNKDYGSGEINFSYTPTRYWFNSTNGNIVDGSIGVISGVNDFSTEDNAFAELTYTQTFAGDMDWLSLTLGQFPIYSFDGNNYNSNQQVNFINFALSQNGSSSYPVASLGGYLTFEMGPHWQASIGMQDANNISGANIDSSTFTDGDYTSFAYLSYAPKSGSQYTFLYYNQPSVKEQPGTSNGWSVNLEQSINETYALFGRVNGVSNSLEEIENSYVIGGVMNNPLNRNSLDQIGLATAINKSNKDIVPLARDYETVVEAYWAWGIGNFMTITPDIQFFIKPALNPNKDTATAASLRTNLMF